MEYEAKAARQGFRYISGVDEAGRGPLAGPVVAAAVIFSPNIEIVDLDDSKKLSPKKREELFLKIKERATTYGIAVIGHRIIDEIKPEWILMENVDSQLLRLSEKSLKLMRSFNELRYL